ncbi:uncharacterized protein LOC114176053 [Vigna unguiculata]|uniref:Uncharacterized protein n=1 Tax=Vigna unguiculata TaxID=3917 RepID=A0A4D6L9N5_VIGUN|nr:uncharacterized protein LOC114176053 [Vigna unguiculata]QCD85115.1 hypothetical protein DEO72_LG2g5474 [Vigna unguiculata]
MEKKSREEKLNQVSKGNVWDCGSTLYDSFELNSLKRELNTAIANSPKNRRTLSMSHLPERCLSLQLHHPQPPIMSENKPFKISRTFHKLLRFVFKSSNKLRTSSTSCSRSTTPTSNTTFQVAEKYSNKDRFYVVYDKSEPVLSTIPELPEFELPEFEVAVLSPEIASFVRKSASERFMATAAIGISCA